MIDVSSITQLAQQQPIPVDIPRPILPVAPVEASMQSSAGGHEQAGSRGAAQSLDANIIKGRDSSLQFRIDQDYDRLVVTLLDADGKTVRQIPSELILKIAQRLEQIIDEGNMGLNERA
jgi:hypothetical protein